MAVDIRTSDVWWCRAIDGAGWAAAQVIWAVAWCVLQLVQAVGLIPESWK